MVCGTVELSELEHKWYTKLLRFRLPQDLALEASRRFASANLCPDRYATVIQLRDDIATMQGFEDIIAKIQLWLGQITYDLVFIVAGAVTYYASRIIPEKQKKFKIAPKVAGIGLVALGIVGAMMKAWPIFFPEPTV